MQISCFFYRIERFFWASNRISFWPDYFSVFYKKSEFSFYFGIPFWMFVYCNLSRFGVIFDGFSHSSACDRSSNKHKAWIKERIENHVTVTTVRSMLLLFLYSIVFGWAESFVQTVLLTQFDLHASSLNHRNVLTFQLFSLKKPFN